MLIGTITNEGGAEFQRHAARRRRQGDRPHASSTSCPITARSTRSASSRRARCPSRSNGAGVKLGVPVCEDMWLEPVCAHLAELGAELFCSSPTAAPTSSTRTRRASGWRGRGRPAPGCRWSSSTASAARTSWPSTARPSSCTPTARCVVQMADWDEALLLTDWERGAGRLALRDAREPRARCLPRRRLPGDDGRACATMSGATASPA